MRACAIRSAIRTFPSPGQRDGNSIPGRGPRNPRLRPPQVPRRGAMASSRDGKAASMSYPFQLHIEEAKLQVAAAEELGALFFRLPLGPWGRGPHSRMACCE